jgi:hypothetical protein
MNMLSEQEVSKLIKRVAALEDQVAKVSRDNNTAYSAYGSANQLALRVVSLTPQLLDVVWKNNTPAAGSIAWSAGMVIYNGEVYDLFAGSSANKYIYWTRDTPRQFQSSNTFPDLGDDDFLIATNLDGVHDLAWHNASADSHIVDRHIEFLSVTKLVGSLLESTVLSLRIIIVDGMTLSNNNPSAGSIAWSSCQVFYAGTSYNISAGNTSHKFVYWDVGDSSFSTTDTFVPQTGRYQIATNTSGVADEAWSKIAAGAVVDANILSVQAAKINGQLVAGQIATAAIDATKVNLKTLILTGLVLTDNSPAAGRVAWSACTVFFNGSSYSVASGDTSSASHKFITWTVGASVFSSAEIYTPSDSVFLIATNTGGTSSEVWNKGGTGLSALVKSNMSFGLLEGFQLQPTAFLTLTDPEIPFASGAPASLAFNLLTVNQPGVLLNCRIQTTDPYVSNPGAISLPIGAVLNLYLRYTIDGAPSQLIRLGTWSVPSSASYGPIPLDDDIQTFAGVLEGDGSAANDILITSNLGLTFTESCVVDVLLATNNASINAPHRKLYGETKFRIAYALKV